MTEYFKASAPRSLRRGPCREGWKEAGAGSACPGGGSNENFKPAKVVFPPAAECRRRASAYRAERRTAAVGPLLPLRTRSPVRTRPGHRGERRPASPPVRALASVGNQTYQTILPASQPASQPAKSCEDCLEREADTRAPAASKQAVLASEGETAAARGRIQVILPRTESISNQYGKFAGPK